MKHELQRALKLPIDVDGNRGESFDHVTIKDTEDRGIDIDIFMGRGHVGVSFSREEVLHLINYFAKAAEISIDFAGEPEVSA